MVDWREEEHPRIEDGTFTYKNADKRSSIDRIKRIMEERKRGKTVAQKQNKGYNIIELDKVVWAKFYNKVAEIQHGGAYEKTKSGNISITIEHEEHITQYCIMEILKIRKY